VSRKPPPLLSDDGPPPDRIAAHLGDRLRVLRHARNLNQGQLGILIGVTAQQIHRYERGKSAITAISLWRLARALNAPIGYFFEGLGEGLPSLPPTGG
jgi:transcriptional regulator with XRE-family HTH domain